MTAENPSMSPSVTTSGTLPPGFDKRYRWVLRPAAIYLISRALFWAAVLVTASFTNLSVAEEIDRWDSRWFLRAAAQGWPSSLPTEHGHVAASTIAFFPLFPLVIRWTSTLTGLSYLASGIAVASLSGLTAMVGVWYLVRSFADRAATDRGVLLLAFFPGSFVLNMVYAEGMMVTLVAFGLWALLARRWVLAGLLGALASATSPVALAFELSCLWCAYRALADGRDWRSIAAPVLAPLGFVAFQAWLWVHTGDLWAWRLTERYGWRSTISPAFGLQSVLTLTRHPMSGTKTEDLLFAGIVIAVVGAVFAIRRRMPMPVLLYGLGVAVLAFVSSPVGLRPRFLFDAFPLVIGVGLALRRWRYAPVLLASALSLVALTAFELASYQVFP